MKNGIVGIDEVGRGPLAGPVVVCCVYIPNNFEIPDSVIIRDSKKMTHKQRVSTISWLNEVREIKFEISEISVEVIDKINILEATLLGMRTAFDKLKNRGVDFDEVFVDGNRDPNLDTVKNVKLVVRGDDKIKAISLASIIAKEYRDSIMSEIDLEFPVYGFSRNVGYGTKQHLDALKQYGFTKYHRKSFSPIKNMIE